MSGLHYAEASEPLDSADRYQWQTLRDQAARCRRLAGTIGDGQAINALTSLAQEYDAKADRIGSPLQA
jgi:hypothetical protein